MPYPTSLRIVNWIKWIWKNQIQETSILLSLWNQLRWLSDRPEHHVLGNHLFSNAKALLFGGVFFKGLEAERLVDQALQIIDKELDEQFQPDGSQFERSPMYHALAMEDLLDILNIRHSIDDRFDFSRIVHKVEYGLSWLEDFSYTKGDYAHFNDCANGIAPPLSELKAYAQRMGFGNYAPHIGTFWVHPDSGHVIYRNDGIHFIADVGRIGPDYLMAHAHADTLSFELEWQGQRIFVNSGTSLYEASPERLWQRSTAAHSTLTINDKDSSEVWSSFRVARRAYPFGLDIQQDAPDQFEVHCSHDGYRRLKGKPVHQRTWSLCSRELVIEDNIIGPFQSARARYYLHPDLRPEISQGKILIWKGESILASILATSEGYHPEPMIRKSTYHPEFGLSIQNHCLEWDLPPTGKLKVSIQLCER